MTGYKSKRAAARDKLVDDRRAYYEKFDDLYAVYLNGVYDGKKAAQPAQEPIGYAVPTFDFDNSVIKKVHYSGTVPLYTAPPQRPWVGLTDEEVCEICDSYYNRDSELAQMVEAKLKEKNL